MSNENAANQARQSTTLASSNGNDQMTQTMLTKEKKSDSPLAKIKTAPPLMRLEFSEKQEQNQSHLVSKPMVDSIGKGE